MIDLAIHGTGVRGNPQDLLVAANQQFAGRKEYYVPGPKAKCGPTNDFEVPIQQDKLLVMHGDRDATSVV